MDLLGTPGGRPASSDASRDRALVAESRHQALMAGPTRWPALLVVLLPVCLPPPGTHALQNGVGLRPPLGWSSYVRGMITAPLGLSMLCCCCPHRRCTHPALLLRHSWNHFAANINADILRQTADAMASNGLRDSGYEYLNLGACAAGLLLPARLSDWRPQTTAGPSTGRLLAS